ncbi:MAG: MGMT family protein [Myxococcales bacterium]|nr:MGMT family protein [Myxococcales bacterium]MCB9643198.1 MGMT family protein [Myxococcales bacterium]
MATSSPKAKPSRPKAPKEKASSQPKKTKKKTASSSGSLRQEIHDWVRCVPYGYVASYGQIGQMLSRPCSGLVVGKQIANTLEDIPWWRIVGADGTLLLRKRSIALGDQQAALLQEEGVAFDQEGCVQMKKHQWNGVFED